jgi:hypothetical protein
MPHKKPIEHGQNTIRRMHDGLPRVPKWRITPGESGELVYANSAHNNQRPVMRIVNYYMKEG